MSPLSLLPIGLGLALLPFLSFGPAPATTDAVAAFAVGAGDDALALDGPGRFIGAKACKNCHNGEDKGNIHDKWAASAHARAYATLGTPEAKKIAAGMGIDDPQKSEKCLECHVTAFGVDPKEIKKGFLIEDGVQCETCHGAGEEHFKVRFKESMQKDKPPSPIGENEVHAVRDPASCIRCHNERSPTHKEFCFKERMAEIEHLDPRRERTEEELAKLRETCTPDCPKCKREKEKKDGE
ncbi:MAG: hypothetical protein IPM29_05390 [Planctomycetes bacterium]|nr:hypothetical protein [Planctomycetota bacterium]